MRRIVATGIGVLVQCGEYKELVAAHVDGQLAPEEDALAAAHVATCVRCARLLASERQFAQALRARDFLQPTPPHLRQRVLAMIEGQDQPPSGWARVQRWWARPAYRAVLVAAGAALVLAIALPLLHFTGQRDERVLREVVEHYRQAEALRLEVKTDNPEELQHYFEGKGIVPPTVTVMDLRPLGFQLVGGSVTQLGPAKSVMMVYQGARGWILCHRFRAADLQLPPGEVIGGDTYYTVDRLTLCTYRDGDAICIMAAAMPRADFMKLIAGYV